MRKLSIGAVAILVIGLGACADSYGPKQTGGTLIGAGVGGLAGSQIGHGTGRLVAVGAGTLLGALLGGEVGRSLDKSDQLYAERASHRALESGRSGQPIEWRNPDSGHEGWTTPQPAFKTQTGEQCREFTQTVVIGGRQEQAYGTACRQPDGTWRVVS